MVNSAAARLRRTSPDSVLFTTYNVLNLFQDNSAAGREHYQLVGESIRALGTDVLAVQEIRAHDEAAAGARLRQLADDVGLCCAVPQPDGGQDVPALAMGGHGFHCGLMWRDGIQPVPGSLRCHGPGYFWHSLACVELDVGGVVVRHAAHHATPFGRRMRADQNEVLVALLTRPRGLPPTLVGADWNTACADRVLDEGTGDWVLYEHDDPWAKAEWTDDMIFHCEWDYDECGRRRHRADRGPGEVLWAGGLRDAAAALRAPWRPTFGHNPDDPYAQARIQVRIDGVRVTRRTVAALRAHHVEDTELARRASDHLPVTVEYAPTALR
ncbi:MAG TPA: endonuclease/exonuclease/phosphatase family protein [Streptosporangiaceae bacterium]|nr:endonuclease/exonuclease/phosphatase family protein [Streptosporangiaceae bacterium]